MAKYGSRKESNACCTLTYYSNDDDDGLLNEVPKNLKPYLRVLIFLANNVTKREELTRPRGPK
jgi:hypothetical protein